MAPTTWTSTHSEAPDVLIIGAGISGICTAIDLIRENKNIKFIIIEKGNQIGGTWNDNQYPGCCCDVWSHLYSLSFEQNPDWSKEYPGQEEILKYLKKVAQKWGLYDYIQFNTVVEEAQWQEEKQKWITSVKVTGGKAAEFGEEYTITSDYLVSAVGQLNSPRYPDIEGLEEFKGTVMHSARWNWNNPIAGKKIGIIGNGATAAQIVPEISKIAQHLTIFQRTPNWIVPRNDQVISSLRKAIYRYIPAVRQRYRSQLMDIREMFYDAAVVEDSDLNNEMRRQCIGMMKDALADKPQLCDTLTPDYPPGCKRIIISDDYYPTLNQPNVSLETRSIQRITPRGIIVDGQEIALDVLILATGFRTVEFMYPIKIYGKERRSIDEIWEKGARAYLGVTVESLPNFSMLYGPNTNLGHNSIILMIEAQSRYIVAMIKEVINAKERGERLSITPSQAMVESYNAEIQSRLQKSTFAHEKCKSWYKNSEGLITNNWCGNVVEYQKIMSTVEWNDYELSGTGAEGVLRKVKSRIGRVVEESSTSFVPIFSLGLGALATAAIVGRYLLYFKK